MRGLERAAADTAPRSPARPPGASAKLRSLPPARRQSLAHDRTDRNLGAGLRREGEDGLALSFFQFDDHAIAVAQFLDEAAAVIAYDKALAGARNGSAKTRVDKGSVRPGENHHGRRQGFLDAEPGDHAAARRGHDGLFGDRQVGSI